MSQTIHFVDAFTDTLFQGNPAGVLITEQWLDDSLMQNIATENNLAETAFLKKLAPDQYHIRWFSPITEIDFCGHATLAACSVIFEQHETLSEIKIQTKTVGELTIFRQPDGKLSMKFPIRSAQQVDNIPPVLLEALPVKPAEILCSPQAWFAIYQNEQDVLDCKPDLNLVKTLAPLDLVVTAPGSKYDFVSRYFWPANGGDEDPVTGSIHAGLTPYWAERLDKTQMVARQASRRGGILYCELSQGKVIVSGYTRKYLKGEIYI